MTLNVGHMHTTVQLQELGETTCGTRLAHIRLRQVELLANKKTESDPNVVSSSTQDFT
jgi:hypothetical protein